VDLTRAERALLQRLAEAGGRYTFRPDGENALALRAFEVGILATLVSLQEKQLVRLDTGAIEVIQEPARPVRFASVTAELTEAGRARLR
jgi:hypothetical protein